MLISSPIRTGSVRAEYWPGWRGPRGDGTSLETGLPTAWDGAAGDSVAWKIEVPGRGHSSPIVFADQIFLATALEDHEERALCSFDRRTGKLLWQHVVLKTPLEGKHELNSYASSTPATDGQRVYVAFLDRDQMAVAAYDFAGQQQWLVRPGGFSSKHGFCSCPVVFEELVIVNGDHDGDSYLVALDRRTGETVWKVSRENHTRSYCTPIIREIDGRTHLILSGDQCVASYDPRTGQRHWIIDGPTEQFVASIVDGHGLLFMTCGFPEHHILAIRPDGRGNITDTHIAWRETKGAAYVPSPIAVGDYFLVVSDGGVASCLEAVSGHRVWMQRLGTHYSASPVTANGLAYFTSDDGVTQVIRPAGKFELVAENQLGEQCFASPAVSGGQIIFRGEKHLIAVGP
ncbi:MAG: PQQ-like beta-propeller repeat protein [Pirellulales bacterium]|nr:PQQ-like beta-propeller repeat protein [Pirellulales bacterium]